MEKQCQFCKEFYETHPSYSKSQIEASKYCSLSCGAKYKKRVLKMGVNTQFKKGENLNEEHPNWKGLDAHIKTKHAWVVAKLGKAKECSVCGKSRDEAVIDWANIDHMYSRNLQDYVQMCRSCHRKYDIANNGYRSKR